MASSNFLTNLKRVLREENKHQHSVRWQEGMGGSTKSYKIKGARRDISPVGFLHGLLDGPETDIVPLGDLDKVLKTQMLSEWSIGRISLTHMDEK